MRDNIANTSLWTLMNENIIHIFLWFYAWLWSISRGGHERDKHRGAHCYFDITNNCIYDGIMQFIYFPLRVPIKWWHFPSGCSLLMFYVLLSSRGCVLFSKRANFSQCEREEKLASVFLPPDCYFPVTPLWIKKMLFFFFQWKCHTHKCICC